MFVGVQGGGADLAWLSTAMDQEEAALKALEHLLAMIDIYKCFDQLVPALVRAVCMLAGMPTTILLAYSKLLDRIKVVHCLPLGAGKP